MTSRAGRALGWFGFLGAVIVALRLAGAGDLATPPLTSLDDLGTWVDARDAATTAVALVRLAAEVTAWYVLGLSALHAVAGAVRSDPIHALADALAVPAARRVVHGALGMGLVTIAPAPPGDTADDPVVDLLADVDAGEVAQDQIGVGTATMRPVDPPAPPGTARMVPLPVPRTWTVHEGESFWTIAADVLEEAWGRAPSDREIDPFWRALVEANRDRLVERHDPDLVLPGQVFEVPAVPQPH